MQGRIPEMSIANDGTYNQYAPISLFSIGENQTNKTFTNKDLIIPFTMSKANSAQGGTYVPREDLLAKIEKSFTTERIVFLSGMGGCGKSELARAYGYKHRDDYEEIFWLTCDDGVAPDLMSLMEKESYKIEKPVIREFTKKVLIIVDNCNREEEKFLFELEYNTGNAHILISTRLSFVGNFEAIIPVESSEPEKFAYCVFKKNYCKRLRRRSAKEINDDERALIYRICEIVRYNTMIVSLLAIKLREDDSLSISDCVQKIRSGLSTIEGEVKYSKDLKSSSKDMRDILSALFSDILHHNLSEEQKAILTVLCLTPATWYGIDYICALLDGAVEGISHKRAAEELLDFGWLQGNDDRMTIHPLIAEVISNHSIIITESTFFEGLLENYLVLSDEYLRKENYLISEVLKRADKALPIIQMAVMLLLDHSEYKRLLAEIYPELRVAYFVYVDHCGRRYYMYRDIEKDETCEMLAIPNRPKENKNVQLLRLYNIGIQYRLDLNVEFCEKNIEEVPDGLCNKDRYLITCSLSTKTTKIGSWAFAGCSGLSGELLLPDGLQNIGEMAFVGCSGLSGELRLPDSLQNIDGAAFMGCSGLSGELRLPDSLQNIDDLAFAGCSGLSGELRLPDGLRYIEDFVFAGCSGLSGELRLPNSLQNIGDLAFAGCSGLSGELRLPDGLQNIGDLAFAGCSGLSGELRLPDSLQNIGNGAFWRCDGIVKYDDVIDKRGQNGFFTQIEYLNSILSMWEIAIKSIFEAGTGLRFRDVFPNGLLGDREVCENMTGNNSVAVQFEEDLKSIRDLEFAYKSNLSGELRLPDSLQTIGEMAFAGCSGLSGELRLPDSLQNIDGAAFMGCSGLSGELRLPDGLLNIGEMAFLGCTGLSGELRLPDSLQNIGDGAFLGCSGLSGELRIPEGVTSIGKNAFYGCDKINKVIFSNPYTEIDSDFLLKYSSTTIVGYRNSTAESYAREHNFDFEELKVE